MKTTHNIGSTAARSALTAASFYPGASPGHPVARFSRANRRPGAAPRTSTPARPLHWPTSAFISRMLVEQFLTADRYTHLLNALSVNSIQTKKKMVMKSVRNRGERLLDRLESPKIFRRTMLLVPLACAVLSWLVGQDANWDLLNYHLYNPYAWLNGLVGLDLAPAGFQSYFNPLLDVPYYLMVTHWPASLVACVMGLLQGLNFVFLLLITRAVVVHASHPRAIAVLLALCGCCSAVFLSELGNTMGDNLTSVLVLAGFGLLTSRWTLLREGGREASWILLLAGCLLGAAAGLKLTNAVYALAAAVALLCAGPAPGVGRWRIAALLSLGIVLGMGLTSGFWFMKMWTVFGNPLFPQFNSIFRSDMAAGISVADLRWRPASLAEAVFFPFVFAWRPGRVGESALYQIALPALYCLMLIWVGRGAWQRFGGRWVAAVPADRARLQPVSRFVLVFVSVAYLVWMSIFSIHRYLVPLEMLAPLAIWLLARELFHTTFARRFTTGVLSCGVLVVLLTHTTWGNVPLAAKAFRVQQPPLTAAARTAVVMLQAGQHAWMLPFFPAGVRAVSLGSAFPESPAYVDKARSILREREEAHAIFEASKDSRPDRIARINGMLESLRVDSTDRVCHAVRWALGRNSRLNARVVSKPGDAAPCRVELDPAHARDLREDDRAIARQKADFALRNYGLALDTATCARYSSWVGSREDHYQFCRIAVTP